MHFQAKRHVVVDRHMRIERIVLEDHRDITGLGGNIIHANPVNNQFTRADPSRPAIIRSVVDFPQPDGPTKTINSLSSISRLKSFTTWTGYHKFSECVSETVEPLLIPYQYARMPRTPSGVPVSVPALNEVVIPHGSGRPIPTESIPASLIASTLRRHLRYQWPLQDARSVLTGRKEDFRVRL